MAEVHRRIIYGERVNRELGKPNELTPTLGFKAHRVVIFVISLLKPDPARTNGRDKRQGRIQRGTVFACPPMLP
jgi:hypothetical protein